MINCSKEMFVLIIQFFLQYIRILIRKHKYENEDQIYKLTPLFETLYPVQSVDMRLSGDIVPSVVL